jgi:hypothetical protein
VAIGSGRALEGAIVYFVIAGDGFTIDNAGARAQAGKRLDNQREAMREVIAGTAIEPHPPVALAGNDVETVVLDLMQPWLPEGNLSVFVGRHGAMNPAGRVGCNMPDK